ncbi:MAG: MoaD/ThiS family protein [Anaerolineae bacterium]
MIQVKVKLGEPLWRAVGQREVEVTLDESSATVADVLVKLAEGPGFRDAYDAHAAGVGIPYALFVDDKAIPVAAASETPVANGQTLRILLPIAGG